MITKQVLHNSKEYWELVRLRDEVLRKPLNLKFTQEELLVENNQLHFGIFEGDRALACIILVPQLDDKIKMRQVCVDSNYQGQSLGKSLNQFCENYARNLNFSIMLCHARFTAKDFYLSQGYIIEGEGFQEVGIDHYYMWKEL